MKLRHEKVSGLNIKGVDIRVCVVTFDLAFDGLQLL